MFEPLRARLREARASMGLTQAQLAARSGTSRVTVARFEAGSGGDVRIGTLAGLCEALDLELSAVPRGSLAVLETRLAREAERERRLDRQLRHARLGVRLMSAPRREGQALVERARRVVERWEREQLCSSHYISRWRRLLDGSPAEVAKRLLDPGDWRDALYQNTPWSFALEKPSSP